MKYILVLLLLSPMASFGQQNCTTAYIHFFKVVDSLPVPPKIQLKVDSAQKATAKDLAQKKKAYQKKYKNPKIVESKLKKDQAIDKANNLRMKRTLEVTFYVKQISAAQFKIYNKGKKYSSVMNADSPLYAKLPDNSCDETAECLKLVRKMLE